MEETIDLITVKEDFENIESYSKLSDADKAYVWEYAERRLIDILMQDYWLCLEACVEGALSMKEFKEKYD